MVDATMAEQPVTVNPAPLAFASGSREVMAQVKEDTMRKRLEADDLMAASLLAPEVSLAATAALSTPSAIQLLKVKAMASCDVALTNVKDLITSVGDKAAAVSTLLGTVKVSSATQAEITKLDTSIIEKRDKALT